MNLFKLWKWTILFWGLGLPAVAQITITQAFDLPRPEDIRAMGFVIKLREAAPDSDEVKQLVGDYVLTPAVFDLIRVQPRGAGGEIQLTDGIAALLNVEQVLAYRYHGTRYDCGSKLGLMQASVVLGQTHPELGDDFTAWLKARQAASEATAA